MLTYDPKQVQIIFGGVALTGFAENSLVKVRRNADAFALTMGIDGEGTRTKSNDKSGQIEVTLMQSSQSNEYLSSVALADETSNAGLKALLVKDGSGSSTNIAEEVYIKKFPDAEFSNKAGDRVWILETDDLEVFVGGN